MKTFAIATITIAAAASLVHAAPAPEPELERRATTNVLLCKNQDFDTCTTLPVVIGGGCYNFPSDYNDVVSSLKTGGPNTQCIFYVNGGCSGDAWATSGPHPTVPSNFNDDLSSVSC